MPYGTKNIAIIGATKEVLKLLPTILSDASARVRVIADPNSDAFLFKLRDLGYRLSERLNIKTTTDLEEIKAVPDLNIIVNALGDAQTERFLESPEFNDVEKLGPLSTRLLWGLTHPQAEEAGQKGEKAGLLDSLREIVDAVRLTRDRKELLSVILKLATESTRAERGSIMLLSPEERKLRVEIAKGMDEEVIRKIRVPLGEGVSGKVALEGRPMIVSGKATPERFHRPMDRVDVKSAMSVPLLVNGKVIGVINVNSSDPDAFLEEDLNFMTSLARLAAEVIHRSNEYEKLKGDSAKYIFWKDFDALMGAGLPLDSRLSTVTRKLSEIIPGLTCFLYVYDEDSKSLVLRAASTRDAASPGALRIREGEGIEGLQIRSRKDTILVDRTDEAEKRYYISLPMVVGDEFVGTLCAQVVTLLGLSKSHESFLTDARNLIARRIYRFREEEKQASRARKVLAVDEAGLEMITLQDAKGLMEVIAATPVKVLGADGSLLRVREEQTRRYQTVSSHGLDDRDVRENFLLLEKETAMEVLRRKEPAMREFSEETSPHIKSVFSYPLRVQDRITGVLTLFTRRRAGETPKAFSAADREIMARFAVYAEKALSTVSRPVSAEIREEAPQAVFERKVEQELNRARRLDRGLLLATLQIKGIEVLSPRERDEFERRLEDLVRKSVRSFDYIAKLGADTFGLLFPDTGGMSRVLETITDVISSDRALEKAFAEGKVEVYYGSASFPGDGESFEELHAKASKREKVGLDSTLESTMDTDF